MRGIIGKKLGMTLFFDDAGYSKSGTVIEVGPCCVTQIKTIEKDGYSAVQLGFGARRKKRATKPEIGHVKKHGLEPFQVLREFRDFEVSELKTGDEIKADLFSVGEKVDVTGVSKGRGFAGTIKRWGFGGGPKTHGQSNKYRMPGSIGHSSDPSRVFKGKHMAGRMGNERVTIKNLEILKIDPENNIIVVKGAVPGAKKGIVLIRK
ncbi:MAG: 50S ribosomal protein L3 [candidate division KSB1 bacterium]|nr:50S ribosomal protein L3 [candidate division KSB1 bacterium]